jgi:hypothetical protein
MPVSIGVYAPLDPSTMYALECRGCRLVAFCFWSTGVGPQQLRVEADYSTNHAPTCNRKLLALCEAAEASQP